VHYQQKRMLFNMIYGNQEGEGGSGKNPGTGTDF
jgi:hypothetical protein